MDCTCEKGQRIDKLKRNRKNKKLITKQDHF